MQTLIHGNDCSLNVLFNSAKSDKSNKYRENFEDNGIDMIQDGYSSVEKFQGLPIICVVILPPDLAFETCPPHIFCLMWGEPVRRLELADIVILDLKNEDAAE